MEKIGELVTTLAVTSNQLVSKELIASIIRVETISKLGATLSVTSTQAVTANVVSSSLILSTLIMEEKRSSETSVLTRATWRHIQEDGILHSHRRENLKFYNADLFYSFIYMPWILTYLENL
jgi:hypothetical protein